MTWQLSWSHVKSGFINDAEKILGKTVPKCPDLDDYLYYYIDAFEVLSNFRGFTEKGIPKRISLQDISSYVSIFGVEDPERFTKIIISLDSAYLERRK